MLGMNYNPTQEDIDSWMAMTDLDGDGKVNLEDYERLIIASLEKCGIKIYDRE
jgi:Ca2+-binding EF-hand superfamily protein